MGPESVLSPPPILLADSDQTATGVNEPMDERLHVVAVVSNPRQFRRRFELARQFFARMEREADCVLYVVELAYGEQTFHVTSAAEPRHLQLRGMAPLWHKENLINCGIRALLPPDWKAVAWIDADVLFESPTWARDALSLLHSRFDVVQLFTHADDLGPSGAPCYTHTSFGSEHVRGAHFSGHTGYAWACSRHAYERFGGLYDHAIIGSADFYMAAALTDQASSALRDGFTPEFRASVLEWQRRASGLRLGCVPGRILHYFHGDKEKRYYGSRDEIVIRHRYSPGHLVYRDDGLLEPAPDCPLALLDDIMAYFGSRDEDSIYRYENIAS